MHATAASTLGYKKRKNQDWFDENDGAISCLIEQKRITFVKTLEDLSPSVVQAHKNICREVQAELRKMQDNWWSNKADELQDLAERHDSRLYEELKTVFGPSTSAASSLRSEDGSTVLTDRASIMQRWNEYFMDLLNRPSNVSMESLAKVHQEPIQEHIANPLTLHEVQAAI